MFFSGGFAQKRARVPPRGMDGPPLGQVRAFSEGLNLWKSDQGAAATQNNWMQHARKTVAVTHLRMWAPRVQARRRHRRGLGAPLWRSGARARVVFQASDHGQVWCQQPRWHQHSLTCQAHYCQARSCHAGRMSCDGATDCMGPTHLVPCPRSRSGEKMYCNVYPKTRTGDVDQRHNHIWSCDAAQYVST